MRLRHVFLVGSVLPMTFLAGCGDGGGSVSSTPTPPSTPSGSPPPSPTPVSSVYDTTEYRRSNAAVQAQALTAYVAGASGQGVTAAVIDSGIDLSSPEFSGRISSLSADLAGNRGLQDEGGHGTAVSDVLLGARNDSGIHGIAPSATLLVARTDTPGSCANASASSDGCSHDDNAIARGVDLAVTAGARVINISLGGSPANSTLRAAIGRATSTGIIIVISAGNEGVANPSAAANPDPLAQIAIDPIARGLVLVAGATNSAQVLADFSNKAGNSANYYLTALGERVRSVDQTGTTYLYSGTSFSAPVIAGAVALIAQAFPQMTGAQIVDLLTRTATDLGATGTDTTYGRGEVNLARAFAPQGSLSLPGSAVPVSLTSNGTLSAAMGDAGQSGMSVSIRDMYARDFTVDLAPTLSHAPRAAPLAPALANSTRYLRAGGATTTLALSIADQAPQQLLLSRNELGSARALAGSLATRISRDTTLALGFATGSQSLDRDLAADRTPAFLVADDKRGLETAPQGAFALRHTLGGVGLTFAAETGDMRLWEHGDAGPRSDRYRRYGYGTVTAGADGQAGPFALGGRLTRMTERETVLGARFLSALGGGGATSWFADAHVSLKPAAHWRLGADFRRGWTAIPAGPARSASMLATQALSLDVVRTSVFTHSDSLALRWAEPLRVTSGGITLTGFDTLSLAPLGHERDLEAVYVRALGPGWLAVNSYWRQQPNNFVAAPDDIGLAARYSFGF